MVIVEAKITCKPGKRDEFIKLVQPVVTATRKEDGCVGYALLASTEDANGLMFYEQWRDRDALKAHGKSAHMADWMKKREELGLTAGPSALKIYDIKEKDAK